MRRLRIDRRFAVFSDVHANLPGLEAILADIEARSVPQTLCLGDLVGYGPFPNEVAALVRDRGIPTLMGNYDQGIGFATGDCGCVYKTDEQRAEGAVSLAWTDEVVSEETRAYLRTLDDRFVLETQAGELLAVHGSPRRINEYLFEDRPASAMERMAAEYPYRAILFGHTHVPFAREVSRGRAGEPEAAAGLSTLFVNVGSAGRPKDGDWRACYALVDPDALAGERAQGAGRPGAGPAVEFVRVPYDYERLAAAVAATQLITRFARPHTATQERHMSQSTIYSEAVDELVAVGAAIGSNCEPCLTYHVGRARDLGVPDDDILRAVQTARTVKAAPARNVARLAGELLRGGGELDEPAVPPDASPCCRSPVDQTGDACAGGPA